MGQLLPQTIRRGQMLKQMERPIITLVTNGHLIPPQLWGEEEMTIERIISGQNTQILIIVTLYENFSASNNNFS